jgi:hypothetical protein
MALSNWATFAFGKDGFLRNDGLVSYDKKAAVTIYKNWIYISDQDMWCENRKFSGSTIAELQVGELLISNFDILAERSDSQESVFVFAETHDKEYKNKTWMAGIGAYGYNDSGWVGITEETYKEFLEFLDGYIENNCDYDEEIKAWRAKLPVNALFYNQGDAYFAENIGFEVPVSETP